ncbi:MAG: NIPSNAP family protein [Haliscomenobacter sp.]|nr:NIPSNAP family protein [Haliscomenobacter sp.]
MGFNAVFYAEVLSGRRMPNLMYMTSFDNIESRDAHWKSFGADPFWKKYQRCQSTSIRFRRQIFICCILRRILG